MAKKKEASESGQPGDEQIINSYAEQINYLQDMIAQMQQNIDDIDSLKSDLTEAERISPGQDIMAPIANGIFVKAKLESTKKLLINIGRGIVVEKTIPETISLLDRQKAEIDGARADTIHKLEQLYAMLYKNTIRKS